MRMSLREIEEKGGMKKSHIEKGGKQRSLEGKKKSLIERGERGDRRNSTKKEQGEVEVLRRAPMNSLKCHVPTFIGEKDVESYLEWEIKLCRKIREGRRRRADKWADLKYELRLRLIPIFYTRDLYN
ncbi:hypothetical protein CR513_29220, partial [Mucuna pruriens]